MEAAPAHHALKVDVKRQSKGPQSYAYGPTADLAELKCDFRYARERTSPDGATTFRKCQQATLAK
jgi:hypothetical protein